MSTAAPGCPVCEEPATRLFAKVDGREYWRCSACAASFLSPSQRPDRSEEKNEYDRHQNSVHDAGYRRFLARLADPLLERLAPASEGLDYGCGPGSALAAMLDEAGHRVRLYDPVYRPDAAALAATYDFISCTEVFEHMHRPADEFRRLDALLRPGGRLGVMTQFQTDDCRFATWHYRRDPTHVVFYREATLALVADRMSWTMEIPRVNVAIFRKHSARVDACIPPPNAGGRSG